MTQQGVWEDLEYIIKPQITPEYENTHSNIPDSEYGYIESISECKINRSLSMISVKGHTVPITSRYQCLFQKVNALELPDGPSIINPRGYSNRVNVRNSYRYVYAGTLGVDFRKYSSSQSTGQSIIGYSDRYDGDTYNPRPIPAHFRIVNSLDFDEGNSDASMRWGYSIRNVADTDFHWCFKYAMI